MSILKCKAECKSEKQDELHGEGVRVHNTTQKSAKEGTLQRCTVCHSER